MNIHGTAVALYNSAVLLRGKPGAGKSDLALRLIDRGATLISDDRVIADVSNNSLLLSAPEPIKGLLEVRGLGIVHFETAINIPLLLVIDLVPAAEVERLPFPATTEVAGLNFSHLKLEAKRESLHIVVELAMAKLCGKRKYCTAKETWGL